MSTGKIAAKTTATEKANSSLFWQVSVKKNRLRVVETYREILQRGFSPCQYASFFFFLLLLIFLFFYPLVLVGFGN